MYKRQQQHRREHHDEARQNRDHDADESEQNARGGQGRADGEVHASALQRRLRAQAAGLVGDLGDAGECRKVFARVVAAEEQLTTGCQPRPDVSLRSAPVAACLLYTSRCV